MYNLLNDAHKLFTDMFRLSSVEPEYEFVQIILQILRAKTPLMGYPDQALDQRGDQVNTVKVLCSSAGF